MRVTYALIGLVVFMGLADMGMCAEKKDMSRTRELLCSMWQFHLGDAKGAEAPGFDGSSWRTLDLPHDWSIELPYDPKMPNGNSVGYLPGGIGWYRKAFTIPEADRGKKIVIDFDGVYMDSQVWINGHLLGRRPYGYVSFRYDLTPHLKYGDKKNVIAVRVNVEPNGSRWYPGAGIYRRVWLTTMSPVHVAHWGTFVTTPEVSKKKAVVRLRTEVENNGGNDANVALTSVIVDPAGKTVAKADAKHRVAKGAMHEFDQQFGVTDPLLWCPDRPDMYKIVSTVTVQGKTVDTYTTPLGIRTCKFTNDQGFFLNGEHVDIKGVCLHHDFGPIGTAFYSRALERQLEILRDMGCNAIRTAHNPRDPEFYSICDRMGFLVMDEAFDVWEARKLGNDYHKFFKAEHERDLTSMIRRDRNHPCIVIYSIGNEMNEQNQSRVKYPTQGGDIATRLVEIVRQHDPTRAITAACNHRSSAEKAGIVAPLDVYGQNYGMKQFRKFPRDKPVIGTENATSFITRGAYAYELALGKGIEVRIQDFKNSQECTGYGRFWGADRTDGTLVFMRKNPHVAGQFAWTGFDYMGECFPFKWPARNGLFGIIDMVGFPKDSYYAYQSDWTDEPMVHLIPQNWNWPQLMGHPIPVWAYSNCDEIELFLNGRSLGIKQINRDETLHAAWDVKYANGELKAVGLKNGKAVCTNIIRTPGEPVRLELAADRAEIAADGNDLSFIEVKLVDQNGVLCQDSDRMVQVKIKGDGVLFGVGNGSAFNHEPFKGDKVRTFYGLCRVIVKSTKQAGKIRLKISADGVDNGEVLITTLLPDSPRLAALKATRDAQVRANSRRHSRHRITAIRQVGKLTSGLKASASSSSAANPPEHAIDGDPKTRWCPANGKTGHSWQVDLGGARHLKGVKIAWQTANKYQYKVEGSADGKSWTMLSDQSKRKDKVQLHDLAFDRKGIRHVRITTTGLPKGLWGTFSEVQINGVIADANQVQAEADAKEETPVRGELKVAPVFKHGPGQHADSVIVSRSKKPPIWSEADARKVVVDEARRHGLELTLKGDMPRVSGVLATRDGKAASRAVGKPITMVFDGISKAGKIAFEVLTSDDVPDKTDNTDRITDFYGAAKRLAKELRNKPGNHTVGVFYDPLMGKNGQPDEGPLRKQVRDFVQWLRDGDLLE